MEAVNINHSERRGTAGTYKNMCELSPKTYPNQAAKNWECLENLVATRRDGTEDSFLASAPGRQAPLLSCGSGIYMQHMRSFTRRQRTTESARPGASKGELKRTHWCAYIETYRLFQR